MARSSGKAHSARTAAKRGTKSASIKSAPKPATTKASSARSRSGAAAPVALPRSGPAPIRELTHDQFAELLRQFVRTPGNRALSEVHLHHTWRPRHRDFRGRSTVEAMRRVHMEDNGWSDIAQHITIDPAGKLWTGRSWNASPASSAGRNGTSSRGPFMFEIVGDFDVGQDPFDGVQKASVIEAVASVLLASREATPIAITDVKFHRDLGSPKSCPGTSIDKDALLALVDARLTARIAEDAAVPRSRAAASRSAPIIATPDERTDLLRALTSLRLADDPDTAEITESAELGYAIVRQERAAPRAVDFGAIRTDLAEEQSRALAGWENLRPHVVNLSKGRFSTGGHFAMGPESIDTILDGIRGYARITPDPRVVLWAHGGLVSEEDGLAYAQATRGWWLKHGVYPIYFVWETGFWDTVLQSIVGARGLDDLWDAGIEKLARPVGRPLWGAMKTSARLCSAADVGDGWPGGAWQFADALEPVLDELAEAGHDVELHAVGHSAGSIFHSFFLPALAARNRKVASLSLLAPAIRVDRFRDALQPLVDQKTLQRLYLFTMKQDAELDDTVGPYLKSLLYLVSRAFEPAQPTPILGLEESMVGDATLKAWLGKHAEIQFSVPSDLAPNPLCQALTHGAFDNDRFTVSAVLRRIKGVPDAPPLGRDDFPQEESSRASVAMPAPLGAADSGDARAAARPRRTAVCVGIDRYRSRPLSGCVADAQRWSAVLRDAGFEVTQLFDEAATRSAILSAMERLIRNASSGDLLAFQYSGHGTQVVDRTADESDGYDEAFVPIDGETGQLLLDDDIAKVLARVPRGVTLTLFMDCCHSGTISRFAADAVPAGPDEHVRYLPLTPEMVAAHDAFRAGMPSTGSAAAEESLPGVVHFAACRDAEYAWESQGQGDFTRAATAALASAIAGRMSNEAFIEAVAGEVWKRGRQHPGLMRLPANLRSAPLLGGAGARQPAAQVPLAEGDASDEALLRAALALVAALRSRIAS